MGRIILSICAVVVAAGLMGASKQADQPGNDNRRESAEIINPSPAVVSPPEIGSDPKGPRCQPGQDNRDSDLCAQWKAADAAHTSAKAAWILGILGLCVGGLTLWAATRAAHWAKKAAEHTEKGAEASDRSADAAVAQQRPWAKVTMQSVKIAIAGDVVSFEVQLLVENVGKTPAVVNPMVKIHTLVAELTNAQFYAEQAFASLDEFPPWQGSPKGVSGVPLWPGEPMPIERHKNTEIIRDAGAFDPSLRVEGCLVVFVAVAVNYKFHGGEGETRYVFEAQPLDGRDVVNENGDMRPLRFREMGWMTKVT